MIGKIISHYKITEKLGEGGMGVVYKAEDIKLKRTVALKFLPPELTRDPEAKKRFIQEAQAASALQHHNICTIHDIDKTADGQLFIVMDYYQGETLKSKIGPSNGASQTGSWPVKTTLPGRQLAVGKVIDITLQIGEGLKKAHQNGIIHRDIKPANILITDEGTVKILDFGLAKLAGKQTKLSKPGSTLGTVAYMSPEQVRGEEVDHRTDIWSLGVVLFEMLTGQLPYEGEYDAALMYAVINDEPKSISSMRKDIPQNLKRIISRSLEKSPAMRYQNMQEVLDDLKRLVITRPVPKEQKKSIVVLPFKNMSADPEQEYFCEGLAEELINALTQIKDLLVVARTSAFSFKGKDIDIREIGRKLNVDTALEGSVRKSGQRLRITAQLVNVEDGYHIWSGQFDREMKDIFDIQEEISLTITDHLKLKLLKGDKEKILKRATEDPEAYDCYLKGRYFWNRRYEKGMQRGLQYFQQAIEKDPEYALPHVGIADTFGTLGLFSFMPPQQAYSRAKAAAKKALEIDSELAEAYASLGWITMWYDWDWPAAERHFLKAIQMKPDYALAHQWYGNFLWCMGRFDESIQEKQKARELEPLEPINPTQVGLALHMARRFDESIGELRKVIESDPEFSNAYWFQSMNFLAKKMWAEAISMLEKFVELSAESVIALSTLGLAYGSAGMKGEALKILKQLDGFSKDRYVGSYWRALVRIGLGKKNEALENLEKAYLERESLMAAIKVWPMLDSLRSEPRFQALLKKMNLE